MDSAPRGWSDFPSKGSLFNAVMDGLGGRLESGGPHPLQEGLPTPRSHPGL